MFEVTASRELRSADLKLMFGSQARELTKLSVTMPTETGRIITVDVTVRRVSFGHAARAGFVCQSCSATAHVLFLVEEVLRCSRCFPRRSRRQTERTLRSWNRLGGREEDALLRLLARPRPPFAALAKARFAMERLLAADRARLLLLQDKLRELEAVVVHG